MNILVIGSEGFIGAFIAKALMGKGHTVTGMDIRPQSSEWNNYRYIQGDIMNLNDLTRAMERVDLVINLAAKHHDFGISREEFFQINEQGTRNALEVMSRREVHKLLYYSSVAVYGDISECSSEETRVNPANDYGASKLAAERLIAQWIKEYPSREALVIRPTVVFGPNNYANMYKLIDSIYKRRHIRVGEGNNIKSACYVENLVDATLFLMVKMAPGMAVYNYSDYDHLTSAEIIDIIYCCFGRKPMRLRIPLRPVLILTNVVDLLAKVTGINFSITANRIGKLNMRTWHGSDKVRALGFTQRITLKEGFQNMVAWYLGNLGTSRQKRLRGGDTNRLPTETRP